MLFLNGNPPACCLGPPILAYWEAATGCAAAEVVIVAPPLPPSKWRGECPTYGKWAGKLLPKRDDLVIILLVDLCVVVVGEGSEFSLRLVVKSDWVLNGDLVLLQSLWCNEGFLKLGTLRLLLLDYGFTSVTT